MGGGFDRLDEEARFSFAEGCSVAVAFDCYSLFLSALLSLLSFFASTVSLLLFSSSHFYVFVFLVQDVVLQKPEFLLSWSVSLGLRLALSHWAECRHFDWRVCWFAGLLIC